MLDYKGINETFITLIGLYIEIIKPINENIYNTSSFVINEIALYICFMVIALPCIRLIRFIASIWLPCDNLHIYYCTEIIIYDWQMIIIELNDTSRSNNAIIPLYKALLFISCNKIYCIQLMQLLFINCFSLLAMFQSKNVFFCNNAIIWKFILGHNFKVKYF